MASAPTEQTTPGKRAARRAATEARILEVARDHLARSGAAALSLRAVARDLGMVSSGLYRYVESRDELLTLLIVRAYTSLAEAVQEAHDRVPHGDLDGRWAAVGRALRRWALDNPHDFALVYGSPVPDYEAPPERTTGPGTAVQALLLRLVGDAAAAGRLAPTVDPERARAAVVEVAADPFFDHLDVPPESLFNALTAWMLLVGSVSAEVFGHFGPGAFSHPETFFEAVVDRAGRLVITAPD